MLHDPGRHEALSGHPWSEAEAQATIEAIVHEAARGFHRETLWPAHPGEGSKNAADKSLYCGAAGTLWGLIQLSGRRDVLGCDPAELVALIHRRYLESPDEGGVEPSLLLGEVGILLVQRLLDPSAGVDDRLCSLIARNVDNPVNEAFWGAPGTMLGALHLHRWTDEPRFRALYLAGAEHLLDTWQHDEAERAWYWHDVSSPRLRYTGASHGIAGNVCSLLRGLDLLPAEGREIVLDRAASTFTALAMVEGELASWPVALSPSGRSVMLVQWCHGAPGIVSALSDFPVGRDPTLDRLLAQAGELIWRAGPLRKGPSLCHGTSGNGYALLQLWRRTGDEVWLDRARAFAMHAIGQRIHGRPTLWTGDLGLAFFLRAAAEGEVDLPVIDTL